MKKLIDLIQRKDIKRAWVEYEKIRLSLSERDSYFFSALLSQQSGNNDIARINYERILAINNNDLASAVNLACIYNSAGNYSSSWNILNNFSEKNRELILTKFDTLFGLEEFNEAEKLLSTLKINEEGTEIFERLAALHLKKGDFEKSIQIYRNLINENTATGKTFSNYSVALNKIGNYHEAFSFSKKAIESDPTSWKFRLNHANILMSLDQEEEALKILYDLLNKKIDSIEIIGNIARLENLLGKTDISISLCNEALILQPNNASILCCLADNFAAKGQLLSSKNYYDKSLQSNPLDILTNWHHSLFELKCGNFSVGWEKYKWGFKRNKAGRGKYRGSQHKEWDGIEIPNKLIVWGEQGIGDELMFSKFLKYIPEKIKEIEVQIDSRLHPVFSSRYEKQNNIKFTNYNEFNNIAHIPIGNLPALFWDAYYSDSSKLKPFLNRVENHNNNAIRVGVTWRGGNTERMQKKRSVPIGLFRRLKSLFGEGIQIIILQYNFLENEINFLNSLFQKNVSLPNYDPTKEIGLWVDHIDSCDLIISVDNSAVHFAGAMGIPTFAMIPGNPDFRWGLSGSSNQWYESVELFRDFSAFSLDDLAIAIDSWVFEQIIKIRGG